METTKKQGRIARGWHMTKSSWQVLKLDKELMTLPMLSMLSVVAAMILYLVIFVGIALGLIASGIVPIDPNAANQSEPPVWLGLIVGFGAYLIGATITNFFSAAVIAGAAERFSGGDPTVKGSLRVARRKIRPLFGFSLLMAFVGTLLSAIEERVPFAGKIAVWLFDAAWNIANIFALPVIVLSKEHVSPLQATKQSVGIIKKVWGEGIIANLGISVIAGLAVGSHILMTIAISLLVGSMGGLYFLIPVILGVLMLFGLIILFETLTSIATTALYLYATTGKVPGDFTKQLLESSMTPKKARKIFA